MAVVLSKKELCEFREYVSDFYLENHGLYGKHVKATWEEIDGAIAQHLKDVKDFKGDTFDREAVRDLILNIREFGDFDTLREKVIQLSIEVQKNRAEKLRLIEERKRLQKELRDVEEDSDG